MILPVVIAVQKGRSSKKVFLSLSGKKKGRDEIKNDIICVL